MRVVENAGENTSETPRARPKAGTRDNDNVAEARTKEMDKGGETTHKGHKEPANNAREGTQEGLGEAQAEALDEATQAVGDPSRTR